MVDLKTREKLPKTGVSTGNGSCFFEDPGWCSVFHSTEYTMTKFNNMPALYELCGSLWSRL